MKLHFAIQFVLIAVSCAFWPHVDEDTLKPIFEKAIIESLRKAQAQLSTVQDYLTRINSNHMAMKEKNEEMRRLKREGEK